MSSVPPGRRTNDYTGTGQPLDDLANKLRGARHLQELHKGKPPVQMQSPPTSPADAARDNVAMAFERSLARPEPVTEIAVLVRALTYGELVDDLVDSFWKCVGEDGTVTRETLPAILHAWSKNYGKITQEETAEQIPSGQTRIVGGGGGRHEMVARAPGSDANQDQFRDARVGESVGR